MNFSPSTIEDIIKGISDGGFDPHSTGAVTEAAKQVQLQRARSAEDAKTIAHAWARFYETPDGRMALDQLFDTTLRRTAYFAQLGIPLDQVALYGALREGQNGVAQMIARLISIGRGDDQQVKPRET